jgi:hypothetical protein
MGDCKISIIEWYMYSPCENHTLRVICLQRVPDQWGRKKGLRINGENLNSCFSKQLEKR